MSHLQDDRAVWPTQAAKNYMTMLKAVASRPTAAAGLNRYAAAPLELPMKSPEAPLAGLGVGLAQSSITVAQSPANATHSDWPIEIRAANTHTRESEETISSKHSNVWRSRSARKVSSAHVEKKRE